jgi:hypothetical protein
LGEIAVGGIFGLGERLGEQSGSGSGIAEAAEGDGGGGALAWGATLQGGHERRERETGGREAREAVGGGAEGELAHGIVDGEGTISFQIYTMPNGNLRITPFLCITNSDPEILRLSMEWLVWASRDNRFGKPRSCQQKGTHKTCSALRLDGSGCRPVIKLLSPYLRSKQKAESADAVLKFFDLRDAHVIRRDDLGRIKRDGYTQEELELVSSIRTHKRAKTLAEITSAPNAIA